MIKLLLSQHCINKIKSLNYTKIQMGDPIQQFISWYRSKCIISKLYFTCSLTLFVLMYFDFVKIESILVTTEHIMNLELWRPLATTFYEHSYSILQYPLKLYISYSILVNLEEKAFGKQNGKMYAEFLWLISVVWVYVLALTLALDFYVMNHFFFMCLCCVWAISNPNSTIELVFGIKFKIFYLPFAYGIYYWIFGLVGFWYQIIASIAFAYLYNYLKFYQLTHHGRNWFKTPKIFQLLVEKYLILEQRLGIVKAQMQQQEDNEDPYAQYGYYVKQR